MRHDDWLEDVLSQQTVCNRGLKTELLMAEDLYCALQRQVRRLSPRLLKYQPRPLNLTAWSKLFKETFSHFYQGRSRYLRVRFSFMADLPQVAYSEAGPDVQPWPHQQAHYYALAPPGLNNETSIHRVDTSKHGLILGFRKQTFWFIIVLSVVVIAAAISGGVGGSLASKTQSGLQYFGVSDTLPTKYRSKSEPQLRSTETITITPSSSSSANATSPSTTSTSSSTTYASRALRRSPYRQLVPVPKYSSPVVE
ncbi:uncharacterized protein BDZ99DRAFT_51187 [Mytilinidion resinicola]|uniref:Uncharacterized protein n=1 Tax=Mytilinidion resinicola TaxID=574789 RepID=A0A6A6YI92_9PEZI|nr:uncharacterized protein BDZ99DRAFT_51187 [Mytilinidion resinicola]KAF2808289.1 hypothetical protein BDZ99DRAFT_51187 [Mytilinidion resinicola]